MACSHRLTFCRPVVLLRLPLSAVPAITTLHNLWCIYSSQHGVVQESALFALQLVAADAKAEAVVHAHPASDMWALGVLAYEMFAG